MLQLNFTPFPTLETRRLTLRQLEKEDKNEIFLLRSDADVNKYLDRKKADSIADALLFIDKINKLVSNNEGIFWGITFKNDTQLIGTICYWNISRENEVAEIGYELLPVFQGKGIMREAVAKIIDFGFENMELQKITAYLDGDNSRSVKLLERNNFRKEPYVENANEGKDDFANMVIYSLNKSYHIGTQ